MHTNYYVHTGKIIPHPQTQSYTQNLSLSPSHTHTQISNMNQQQSHLITVYSCFISRSGVQQVEPRAEDFSMRVKTWEWSFPIWSRVCGSLRRPCSSHAARRHSLKKVRRAECIIIDTPALACHAARTLIRPSHRARKASFLSFWVSCLCV